MGGHVLADGRNRRWDGWHDVLRGDTDHGASEQDVTQVGELHVTEAASGKGGQAHARRVRPARRRR